MCQGENGDLGLKWHQSYGKKTKVLAISVGLAIDSEISKTAVCELVYYRNP